MIISYLLAILGFVFYYLYDINSITYQYKIVQSFFMFGTLCVFVSTVHLFFLFSIQSWLGLIIIMIFLLLLIYTLFFALPFDETYQQANHQRYAYTQGVYALCRHPGVLWFIFMYLSLPWVLGQEVWVYSLLIIVYNIIYIVLQDFIIFPKTFLNYGEYKHTTPFLIPRIKDIRKCVNTMRIGVTK